jgi:GntR family transcriptional repressor for pyruvate dehydrogenase complex
MKQALREDTQSARSVGLDWEVHSQILQMTGSRLIAGTQQILVTFFQIAPYSKKTPASAERIIWKYRELFSAIRDRDVERGRAMIGLQFRAMLESP